MRVVFLLARVPYSAVLTRNRHRKSARGAFVSNPPVDGT